MGNGPNIAEIVGEFSAYEKYVAERIDSFMAENRKPYTEFFNGLFRFYYFMSFLLDTEKIKSVNNTSPLMTLYSKAALSLLGVVSCLQNGLAKGPKKLKKAVADDIRSIFYASSKQKAMGFFDIFREKWQRDLPSAVKCLENSIEACLTYLMCPEEEWISLRTTNIIERLNKEFKRRTKPMEIVAGENACYTLLAFICLKMELHWKS
ncbi:MAG: transposase, partial [Pseudomonadota bacterium]